MSAQTIDEVLERLASIIETAREEKSRAGYFAALYRQVTAQVKTRIGEGWFEDNGRMERMDVRFANRYLEAYERWRAGQPVTGSWQAAFEATHDGGPIILQHLLVGMNAHINLDLAIAAAETAPGPALAGLEADFHRINDILFDLIDDTQERIGRVSPWMRVLDWVGGRSDDELIRFSIAGARRLAWHHAVDLAEYPEEARPARIATMDTVVANLGRVILRPGPMLRTALWIVRRREESDARKVIDALQ